MLEIIKQRKLYFIGYGCFLICALLFLVTHNKGDFVLLLNNNRNTLLDYFFKYITHYGDGLLSLGLVLFLFFKKEKVKASYLLILYAVTSLVCQLLKRLVFYDLLRPAAWFPKNTLNFIDGVDIVYYNTFPSGHTASAFALSFFLTLYTRKKREQLILIVLAIFTAISRSYLCLHFLFDTFFGAIIGGVGSLLIYYYLEHHSNLKTKKFLQ